MTPTAFSKACHEEKSRPADQNLPGLPAQLCLAQKMERLLAGRQILLRTVQTGTIEGKYSLTVSLKGLATWRTKATHIG